MKEWGQDALTTDWGETPKPLLPAQRHHRNKNKNGFHAGRDGLVEMVSTKGKWGPATRVQTLTESMRTMAETGGRKPRSGGDL